MTNSQGSWQPGPSWPSPHSASLRNPAHGRLTHKHPRAQIQLNSSVTSARLPWDPAGDGSPPATTASAVGFSSPVFTATEQAPVLQGTHVSCDFSGVNAGAPSLCKCCYTLPPNS